MLDFDGIYEHSLENGYDYAIVVYDNETIVHICMYQKISMADLEDLKEELKTDEMFGLENSEDLVYKITKITPVDDPESWEEISIKSMLN